MTTMTGLFHSDGVQRLARGDLYQYSSTVDVPVSTGGRLVLDLERQGHRRRLHLVRVLVGQSSEELVEPDSVVMVYLRHRSNTIGI